MVVVASWWVDVRSGPGDVGFCDRMSPFTSACQYLPYRLSPCPGLADAKPISSSRAMYARLRTNWQPLQSLWQARPEPRTESEEEKL